MSNKFRLANEICQRGVRRASRNCLRIRDFVKDKSTFSRRFQDSFYTKLMHGIQVILSWCNVKYFSRHIRDILSILRIVLGQNIQYRQLFTRKQFSAIKRLSVALDNKIGNPDLIISRSFPQKNRFKGLVNR